MKSLQLGLAAKLSAVSDGEVRLVDGEAYTGAVLTYWGEKIAIDVDSIQLSGKKVPLLDGHDTRKNVGMAELSKESHSLFCKGRMLSNDDAKKIIGDSDDGFEWQMSVGVDSERVTMKNKGDIVNGVVLEVDNVHVLCDAVIREVSFTPTGVDGDTSAQILSLSKKEEEMPKEIEAMAAKLSEKTLEAVKLSTDVATKDAEIAALKVQLSEKDAEMQLGAKTAKLSRLAELGIKGKEAETLSGLPDAAFEVTLSRIALSQKQSAVFSADFSNGGDADAGDEMDKYLDSQGAY